MPFSISNLEIIESETIVLSAKRIVEIEVEGLTLNIHFRSDKKTTSTAAKITNVRDDGNVADLILYNFDLVPLGASVTDIELSRINGGVHAGKTIFLSVSVKFAGSSDEGQNSDSLTLSYTLAFGKF